MRLSNLLALAVIAPACGCDAMMAVTRSVSTPPVRGSGVAKEETREVGPFTAVEVSGAIEATVTPGAETSVKLSGDDNLVPLVVTEVRDGKLSVRMKDGSNVSTKLPLRAAITAPKVNSVSASGAVTLRATAGDAERYDARATGASTVTVEGIAAGEASLDASGASNVTASGTTKSLKAGASGASHIHAEKLAADSVDVAISGASGGTVQAAKSVRGDVSGASNLDVRGEPAMHSVSISGASGVKFHPGR
jgi:hypothetical protein